MSNVIIVGEGPAGISASLYIRRAGFSVDIISTKGGSLLKAEKIENYYGFSEAISGEKLYNDGIEGAKKIGVNFINEEVVSLSYDGKFVVRTNENEYKSDAVLLATGSQRLAPNVKGLKDYEGKGVSYCAVCDGFFFRNKPVGVLGSGEYALNEVNELINLASSVSLFTNGDEITVDFPKNVKIYKDKIAEIKGEMLLNEIALQNGESVNLNGLFIAYKTAGSTALAKKIGAATDGNRISVNEKMETSVKGLYAAGDCIGGLLQISKAVSDGAIAGTEMIKYLKTL